MCTNPSSTLFPTLVNHSSILPIAQAKNLILVDVHISYHCCITNYHGLSDLKQDPSICSIDLFYRSEVWAWYIWVLCSISQGQNRSVTQLHSHLELGAFFQAYSDKWQNVVTCGYTTEVPFSCWMSARVYS